VTVKILGSGCNKCKSLEAKVTEVIQSNNINAAVEKVTDLNRMISYGILITPGLVINEQVKSAGIIPSVDQILSWLREVD
jgi:small redox-active disulfide protein 2